MTSTVACLEKQTVGIHVQTLNLALKLSLLQKVLSENICLYDLTNLVSQSFSLPHERK